MHGPLNVKNNNNGLTILPIHGIVNTRNMLSLSYSIISKQLAPNIALYLRQWHCRCTRTPLWPKSLLALFFPSPFQGRTYFSRIYTSENLMSQTEPSEGRSVGKLRVTPFSRRCDDWQLRPSVIRRCIMTLHYFKSLEARHLSRYLATKALCSFEMSGRHVP
jgi:hypothetical protein